MEGVVKWFSIKKGYGFIKAQGKDYFVHRWDIKDSLELEEGAKVSFNVEKVPKGFKAINVKKISERSKK